MKSQALVRVFVAGLLMNGLLLIASVMASAAEVYTATLVEPRGLREPRKAEVTLTIEQLSTKEDTAKLEAAFDERGSDGLMNAIRAMERGVAAVAGGQTSRIHHVRVHEGQAGNTVIIVTEEPLHFPGERPDKRSLDALGIVQLDLNTQGMGRGTLAEVVAVGLKEDGSLEIQTFNQATIQLEDVRRK
ncbi:MAG: hypothetical protein ACRD1X_16905 [Vicinamibacteria bacterium]